MPWLYLTIAILTEVLATSTLKASDGLTRLWPSLITVAGYSTAFYFLSLTLRSIPIGVAYAVWAGVGLALITLVGWFFFKQTLDTPAIIGLSLITAGVMVLSLFSRSLSH